MADALPYRILESHDDTVNERLTGKVSRVHVVTYALGGLGPFRAVVDAEGDQRDAIRRQVEAKARTLSVDVQF